MVYILVLALIIFHGTAYYVVSSQSHTNFWIKRFDLCETNGRAKLFANITSHNKQQYLDFNLSVPFPVGDNIGGIADIELLVSDDTVVPLFTIREKYMCLAANKYLGEFWYDIERAAQVIPGVCPIAAGRYHGHHILLNFNKITLQTFPFGTLKITLKGVDKTSKELILCLKAVIENTLH